MQFLQKVLNLHYAKNPVFEHLVFNYCAKQHLEI